MRKLRRFDGQVYKRSRCEGGIRIMDRDKAGFHNACFRPMDQMDWKCRALRRLAGLFDARECKP